MRQAITMAIKSITRNVSKWNEQRFDSKTDKRVLASDLYFQLKMLRFIIGESEFDRLECFSKCLDEVTSSVMEAENEGEAR